MVKMINARFGNVMYVAEDRVDEYLAKGNRLAVVPKPRPKPEKKPATKKKRTTKK